MTEKNEIPSTDQERMKLLERMLYDKWKDQPATSSQKRMLRKLEIPFESDISKALASFLIREKVDGISLPTSLFQNLASE